MSAAILLALLLEEDFPDERIRRKILRDHSNPLEIPDSTFMAYYRIKKEAFQMVLQEISPLVRKSSIPTILQLSATLRFLGEGGYQRAVGKDAAIGMARSTVSKVLTKMIRVLEATLCPKWIKLKMTEDECRESKRSFFDKHRFPGVVGCIDGTHVKIMKPHHEASVYFNRKGYYSINTMIICDHQMKVRAVDGCHPGSSHDSFIWNLSNARHFFLTKYQSGERGSWLLGDSGYSIEPFLITPFRNPDCGSAQHRFNRFHTSTRNIVERTIGVLKSRFRCLQTALPYQPDKDIKIINVCCALHNICRHYNIFDFEDSRNESDDESDDNDINDERMFHDDNLQSEGRRVREEIANTI